MRCPLCDPRGYASSLTRLDQSADHPGLKPIKHVDAAGAHYHDARVWTAVMICSNGHTFRIRQMVPCTVSGCAFNDDPATTPTALPFEQQSLAVDVRPSDV